MWTWDLRCKPGITNDFISSINLKSFLVPLGELYWEFWGFIETQQKRVAKGTRVGSKHSWSMLTLFLSLLPTSSSINHLATKATYHGPNIPYNSIHHKDHLCSWFLPFTDSNTHASTSCCENLHLVLEVPYLHSWLPLPPLSMYETLCITNLICGSYTLSMSFCLSCWTMNSLTAMSNLLHLPTDRSLPASNLNITSIHWKFIEWMNYLTNLVMVC
jgi:hypothetical protein